MGAKSGLQIALFGSLMRLLENSGFLVWGSRHGDGVRGELQLTNEGHGVFLGEGGKGWRVDGFVLCRVGEFGGEGDDMTTDSSKLVVDK